MPKVGPKELPWRAFLCVFLYSLIISLAILLEETVSVRWDSLCITTLVLELSSLLLSFIRSFGRGERPRGQSCLNYDLRVDGAKNFPVTPPSTPSPTTPTEYLFHSLFWFLGSRLVPTPRAKIFHVSSESRIYHASTHWLCIGISVVYIYVSFYSLQLLFSKTCSSTVNRLQTTRGNVGKGIIRP